MNSKTTIIGLVAAIAVLSGGLGFSTTGVFDDQNLKTSEYASTGFLIGQVIVEAHNTDGELIAYRQSDNAVVDDGEQCILKMLFGSTGETDLGRGEYLATAGNGGITADAGACTGILTGAWDVIAIGVGTGITVADTDVILDTELTTSHASGTLDRKAATTKTWNNGSGLGAGDATNYTKIVLKKTFTASGAAEVTESGLFNSTTVAGSGMLAHQAFTAVVLADGDSITVQWTFRVGN
jgi:hypothetical protein